MKPGIVANRLTMCFGAIDFAICMALSAPKHGWSDSLIGTATTVGFMLMPVALAGVLVGRAPGRWPLVYLATQGAAVLIMVYASWAMQVHPDAQAGVALMFWVFGLLLCLGLLRLIQAVAVRL